MLTVSIRRKFFLLLLAAVLVTPWASAADLQPESPRSAHEPASLEIFSRLWNLLQGVRGQGKEGCRIDPSGRCIPDQSAPLGTKEVVASILMAAALI